ncbi:hypothetical protein [Peristeroidobacter agariperforans]|uniref:hypothetical protein n=1 Tax=Peristeroidobacter agariperforans TaxID=268404 RepID=UPI00101CA874|nr:hypothetical protein [Peristeroidobacter agariperforans]
MKPHLAVLLAAFLAPVTSLASSPLKVTLPYKEVMKASVQSKQPVVYARVGEQGFGVQHWWGPSATWGRVGSMVGGLSGFVIAKGMEQLANSGTPALAQGDAEKLAPLYDREVTQRELEKVLAEVLSTHTLFASPAVIKQLADGSPRTATVFEDPSLIVELHSSLITDYRGLQVTALVYEFSAAEQVANPKSPLVGRVYRNRFDYVSDLLPAPHIKTPEEIKADVEAVKAKYQGRQLTKEERAQQTIELRDAKNGTTLEEWRAPLMEAWLANGGARLHDALKLGTAKVVELMAKDLTDFNAVQVRNDVDVLGWRTLRDVETGRYTSIFVGGPFAGALISEPSGLSVEYCRGTAFSESLPKSAWPKLCANEK